MKPLFTALILFYTAALAQAPQAGQVAAIIQDLSEITGWALRKPVQQETMTRAGLKDFFLERIKEVVKPEDIRVEELTLKKFGLVPPDFDLKQSTVDLLTEQAAAFYDYRKKKMVLLDAGGDSMQQAALVHELAHALADQHFSLEKYLKKGSSSDDGSVARTAVMEGQATWLMSEHTARRLGQSLIDAPLLVEAMSRMASLSGSSFPVFEKVPLYMRESLVFPYAKGMLFQQAVVRKLGKQGFAEVYRRPPSTTQHILHPQTWFDKVEPVESKLPALPGERDYRALADGTVGEFDHSILFRQYAPGSESLAELWRGGRYKLYEHKKDKRAVLAYASTWDSPETAAKVLAAYRKILAGKWKNLQLAEESPTRLTGTGDDGRFIVELTGSTLSSLQGMEVPNAR
jgi:hypothetical protein